MKQLRNKQSGFTLIEVVLVLAIGALIILMAVLAFSGAQRSRRDTARNNLAGTMQASIEQFAANSGGTYPNNTEFAALATKNNWKDPKTNAAPAYANTVAANGGLSYASGYACTGSGAGVTSSSGGYVILVSQESGQTSCRDNVK